MASKLASEVRNAVDKLAGSVNKLIYEALQAAEQSRNALLNASDASKLLRRRT